MFSKKCSIILSLFFLISGCLNAVAFAGAPSPAPSGSRDFYVTNTNSSGAGSYAQAIADMNTANYEANNIVFTSGSKGTITVPSLQFKKPYVNFVNNSGGQITLYQTANTAASPNRVTEPTNQMASVNYGRDISFDLSDSGATFLYAVGSDGGIDVNIHGGFYNDLHVVNTSGASRAIYSGNDLTINGGIDADFYISSKDGNNRLIFAYQVSVDGDVKGNWTGISQDNKSYGIYVVEEFLINGEFAANMDISALSSTGHDAYGVYCRADTNGGQLYGIRITGPVSGDINVTSKNGSAVAFYAEEGTIDGGNADTPMYIAGNILAQGKTGAYGILALRETNLKISGKVEAVDTTNSGNAYAIRTGYKLNGTTISADDRVVVDGGTLIGKVDLGLGNDTFIIQNGAKLQCEFFNIENFQKTGAGTWNVNDNFNIAGLPLTVSEGNVYVNAALTAGIINIAEPGMLGGSGQINAPVNIWGCFAPGNSVGTLTVNGNVVSNNGDYQLEVDSSGNDLLIVNGDMTINNGGTVSVEIDEGYFSGYQPAFKFIEAQSLTGSYSRYTSNNPSLIFRGSQRGNALYAASTRIPYSQRASITSHRSARPILNVFDDIVKVPVASFESILGKMDFMTADDLTMFVSQLDAAKYDAHTETLYSVMDIYRNDKHSRLKYIRNTQEVGPYYTLIRKEENFEKVNDGTEFSPISYGLNIGNDIKMGDKLIAGLGFTYLQSDIDYSNAFVNQAELDTFIFGAYGSYNLNDKWYIDSNVQIGTSKHRHVRKVFQAGNYYNSNVAYHIAEDFSSEYRSKFAGLSLSSGYLFDLPYAVKMTPLISLDASYTDTEDFTEISTAPYALKVKGSDEKDVRLGLGTMLSREIKIKTATVFVPELTLKWLHNINDSNCSIEAAFNDFSDSSFVSYGQSRKTDGLLIDIGMLIKSKEHFSFKVSYAGYLASDRNSSDISFDFNLKF